ncbi:MAG TPA: suppressor of fused domain protein [Steroidobacteraceae bacterium]|nr:suppressor of fused domain protein [Steroidobacteraceae bacterium]
MTDTKKDVVSLSGNPVYYHAPAKGWESPRGEECIEQISGHIEAHLGKIETVFHEILSDTVHIDVHFVKATPEFPFVRLVTSGMSDLPMATPPEAEVPRFLELMMTLPADWKLEQKAFEDERWYWPIRLLKFLARLPHKHSTWLGWGHTVPNGDPAQPYAPNTKLSGAIILPPVTVSDSFRTLQINSDKVIHFLSVVPLYSEEMTLKLRDGTDRLLDKFDKAGINDIVDPVRRNVARKRFGFF